MKFPYKIPSSLEGGMNLVAALHTREHWAVYISLMHHDGCRFDKLVEHFGSDYHEMKTVLDELEKGGLVEWFTVWEEEVGGDLARYYYRVTLGGYRFYFRTFEIMCPPKDISRWNQIQKWTQRSLKNVRSQMELERDAEFLPKPVKRVQLTIKNVYHDIPFD